MKLSNFFNKKNHKNRKKYSWKKRRIFTSTLFAANFIFGNLKINDLKTNSIPLNYEKVILNQEEESNSFDPSYNSGKTIQTGEFGADMKVSLTNEGPVTIIIDTKNKI